MKTLLVIAMIIASICIGIVMAAPALWLISGVMIIIATLSIYLGERSIILSVLLVGYAVITTLLALFALYSVYIETLWENGHFVATKGTWQAYGLMVVCFALAGISVGAAFYNPTKAEKQTLIRLGIGK